MKTRKETLGSFLRRARNAKGLSLRDVERKIEVSNAYLSQLEGNKVKSPSPTLLHALAGLYDIRYFDLMTLAGYPVPNIESSPALERLASRIGSVSDEEADELTEYLAFIRARRTGRLRR